MISSLFASCPSSTSRSPAAPRAGRRLSLQRWPRVAIAALLSLYPASADAFKPAEQYGHRGLTRAALSQTYDDAVLMLTPAAAMITDVTAGNEGTDGLTPSNLLICEPGDGSNLGIPFFQANNHCDDELINACSQLISRLIGNVATFVNGGEIDRARTCLGRALHTTQDFYAHSTEAIRVFNNSEAQYRSETAPGRSRTGLGITNRSALLSGTLSSDSGAGACSGRQFVVEMTPNDVYVGDILNASVPPLVTGFFPGMADLILIEGAPLWTIRPPLWIGPGISPAHWEPPAGHCGHGIDRPLESLGQITRGIAKDRADSQPNWVHLAARDLALEASTDLIDRVVARVRSTNPDQAAASAALERFFGVPIPAPAPAPGVQPPPPPPPPRPNTHVGAVIDVTDSMGPVIEGVKAGVEELTVLAQQVSDDSAGASTFTLVSYADPVISPPLVTTDPVEFSLAVQELAEGYLGGGGDCREPTFSAIREALSAMPSPGDLYVFTNSSSKDGDLEPSIREDAAARDIAIHIVNSGSCSPIDPAYKALSAGTGGQFVEQEPRNPDAPREFLALQAQNLQAGKQQLVLALERTIADPEVITFDVDTSVSRMMVATDMSAIELAVADDTAKKGQITLLDPAGNAVTPSIDGYVGNHYAVEAPAVGTWTLRVSGGAGKRLAAQVNVQSSLDPLAIEFMEEQGRPGHRGLMPRPDRPPLAATPVRIRLGGEHVADLSFSSVRLDGSEAASLSASYDDGDLAHVGELAPPVDAFRVAVRGRLADGSVVQRVGSRVFQASPFELSEALDNVVLVPGVPSVVRAIVSNRGPAAEVTLRADSDVAADLDVEPRELALGENESKLVEVSVTVADEGTLPPAARLTLWAQAGDDEARANFLQTARYIDLDGDADGISNRVEQGPSLNDAAFDGNGDGQPDWQQTQVLSLPLLLGQYSTLELSTAHLVTEMQPLPMTEEALLPDDATSVPFGATRFVIEDTERSEPIDVRLFLPNTHGYPVNRLLAFEAETGRWIKVADYDAALGAFTLTAADSSEIDAFNGAGRLELWLAPAYTPEGVTDAAADPEDSGCGCRLGQPAPSSNSSRNLFGLLALAALARRLRRRAV